MLNKAVVGMWNLAVSLPIEIWFFGIASVAAIGIASAAWLNGHRMRQTGMLAVYYLLASSLLLAIAALVDFADFSFLGAGGDAASGVMLGSVIAYTTVGVIAGRLSSRFPAALSWGLATALIFAFSAEWYAGYRIDSEHEYILNLAAMIAGYGTLLAIRRVRQNLSDNQHVAVIAVAAMYTTCHAPFANDVTIDGALSCLLMVLVVCQFLKDRNGGNGLSHVICIYLILMGLGSVIPPLLHTIFGMNKPLSGLPNLLICYGAAVKVRALRPQLPRNMYWISISDILMTAVTSISQASVADWIEVHTAATILLFAVTCVYNGYYGVNAVETTPLWRKSLGFAFSAGGASLVIVCCATAVVSTCSVLTSNYGVARVLSGLRGTPLWPSDAVFVNIAMREESYWNYAVKNPPTLYKTDLQGYLDKIAPENDRFSQIVSVKDYELEDQGIVTESLGIIWQRTNSAMVLQKVEDQSSAGRLGLKRGDEVLNINGLAIKDLKDSDTWEKLFGKTKKGQRVSLSVQDRHRKPRTVSVTFDDALQAPPFGKVIPARNGKIGYLYLESFNDSQFETIDSLFASFKAAGVRDLVLDLRYNGGGLLDYARQLADLIAGNNFPGEAFLHIIHNSRFRDRDDTLVFEAMGNSLRLKRLVVLTSEDTCSASECLINGLRPYLQVITIGKATCGKPYSMEHLTFGEYVLLPVNAMVVNKRNEAFSDSGIEPDITAKDDVSHDLGDPGEEMLKKALEVLEKEKGCGIK